MNENKSLAEAFEAKRSHLKAVAYQMLGSLAEADDAVQEAWLRASRADVSRVEHLGGWLTTILARVCLDMLRTRKSRREEPEETPRAPESAASREIDASPEQDTLLADSVGLAMLVVLETLAPAERLAFVLHDMFDLSFDEIAPIVGCSSAAARQLASRARRRVQGASADPDADADLSRQRDVVDAFLVASRSGDLSALLAVLDPEVVLRADRAAVEGSVANQAKGIKGVLKLALEIRGASAVSETFLGRAQAAQRVLVNGAVGAMWAPGGKPRAVFDFTIDGGKIVAIAVIAEPGRLSELDLGEFDD